MAGDVEMICDMLLSFEKRRLGFEFVDGSRHAPTREPGSFLVRITRLKYGLGSCS